MKNSRLLTIFVIVFVDLLGFGLILPLLPYYAESYGATAGVVGLLVASYAAAQLLGAPLLGRLSDRFGRRPILLVSVFGTFIGFLLLALAEPIGRGMATLFSVAQANLFIVAVLFLSRILDGLTGGNISVAQAYIADVTDESNRARGLGLIGAAFGLGFIIGPAVGGALSQFGYSVPAYAAAAIALLNLLQIFFLLPESLSKEQRNAIAQRSRPPFTLKALWQALQRPKVGPLLHVRLFFGLAFATFQTVFALFAQAIGIEARTTGFILAYVGILSVITQGGLIGLLTRRFRENALLISALWIMGGALLGWAFTRTLPTLLLLLLPLAVSGGILNTVIQSAISKSVSREEVGGILGLAASLEAMTRVIAPTVGGFLIQSVGVWAPGVFTALLMAWTVTFAYRRIVHPGRAERLQMESSHAKVA
ncbi:MAG: MFS transporter [Anaerolineae bacterium]|jgi:DHA1 family tetracycline resistance protein-like MFS transporter|nr:MAG: MFS transporter [Anaerolineae bacterium]